MSALHVTRTFVCVCRRLRDPRPPRTDRMGRLVRRHARNMADKRRRAKHAMRRHTRDLSVVRRSCRRCFRDVALRNECLRPLAVPRGASGFRLHSLQASCCRCTSRRGSYQRVVRMYWLCAYSCRLCTGRVRRGVQMRVVRRHLGPTVKGQRKQESRIPHTG